MIKVLMARSVIEDVSAKNRANNLLTETAPVTEENKIKKVKLNSEMEESDETLDVKETQRYALNQSKKSIFTPLIGRQILYDASAGEFHNFSLPPRNPSCKVCGVNPTIRCMADSENILKENSKRISEVFYFFIADLYFSVFCSTVFVI